MKLGITTVQRDRAPWIKEWVAFHWLVGFRQFYIFLHQCSDNTKKILQGLKKSINIKTFDVDPGLASPQLQCYQDAYVNFGDKVDWMAFIDADEFLFPTQADTLDVALEEFTDKPMSALGVYWSCFGSSGFVEEPPGLIIENYKYRANKGYSNDRHIKSIVKGGQSTTIKASDPHFFKTPLGTYDENLRLINYGWTDYQPTYTNFCVNHYATQSRSFFLNFKSKFMTPDGGGTPDDSFWAEHDRNDVLDTSMDRFIGPLKKILSSLDY